jgi:hypothetical protein
MTYMSDNKRSKDGYYITANLHYDWTLGLSKEGRCRRVNEMTTFERRT